MTIEELQREKISAERAIETILRKFMTASKTLVTSVKYSPINRTEMQDIYPKLDPIIRLHVEL